MLRRSMRKSTPRPKLRHWRMTMRRMMLRHIVLRHMILRHRESMPVNMTRHTGLTLR